MGSHAGAQTAAPVAEVAVAPFTAEAGDDQAVRAQSQRCFERFASALTAGGIRVVRDPQLSEKNLRSTPAFWAALGRLDHKEGQFQLELRLLEVKSGDELRSYFNADKDPVVACRGVEIAAQRIAAFVKEQRRSEP
jgi:hypothetical protein